jgi:hypothetical protein
MPEQILQDEVAVPVTVDLTAAQYERLENVVARLRLQAPGLNDNDVVDAIFATGLGIAERAIKLETLLT